MIGATGTPRSIRRPARAAVAVLLALAAAVVTLGSSAPGGQGVPAAPAAVADPAAGRIVFAGTNHRGLGRVTGTESSTPLFGPGPVHFDQDPSARGDELVFTSLRDGPLPQVYLRDAAGAVHRLTTGMDTAHPALAPDGKGVVFESREPRDDGTPQSVLWAVNRDGSGLRRITDGAADETHPTVSPDGKWIAYSCTGEPSHRQIYLRPFTGGAPVKVTDVNVGDAVDPTWNPVNDDAHRNQIVYTWDKGGDQGRTLMLTSPTGGDKAFFPGTGSTWKTGSAAWLADGTGVLFLSADLLDPKDPSPQPDPTQPPVVNLYRAPTCDCTPPRLLYRADRLTATPTWLGPQSGGGPVVEQTSASGSNVADVQDVRPDGGDPRDLGVSVLREDPAAAANTDPDPAADPLFHPRPGFDPWYERQTYTPDGRQIVVTRYEDSPAGRIQRIWLADADGGDPHPMNLAGRGPLDRDTDPSVSPDGRLVVFSRSTPATGREPGRPGRILIAEVSTGTIVGTVQPPAGQQGASDGQPFWSPDGKLIVFSRTAVVDGNAGNLHLWTVPADDLTRQSDLSRTLCPGACNVIDDSPAFSPDGRRIAFNRKAGDGGNNRRDGILVASPTGADCTVVLPTGLDGDKGACTRPLPETTDAGPFQPRDVAWTANSAQLVLTARRALPPNSPEGLALYDFASRSLTPLDRRLPGRQKEPAVQQSVDLALSAPGRTPVVPVDGGTDVTITVTNKGPAPSPGTVLTASVPTGARLGALTSPVGTCDAGALRCELGTLAPHAVVRVTARLIGTRSGTQPFGWTVTGTVADPNPEDDSAQTLLPVQDAPTPSPTPTPTPSPTASETPTPPATPTPAPPPPPPAPDTVPAPQAGPEVSVDAQPNPGYVGGRVTVSYTVRNTGQALATGLRLTLGLPAGVPTEALPPGCRSTGCTLADLRPGGSQVVRVVLAPVAVLETTITAELTTTGTDATPGPHRASTPLRILQPRIVAVPPIGKPGFVTSVRGVDFPPGAPVRFTWQPGITAAAAPTFPRADGTFAGQLLILPKDETGPRTITADGPGFSPVTTPFLVVEGNIGPPGEVERR
ncbi:hypothetical protein [Streptomyces sp. 1331.2]|uniref:hypothetical protein n=1 Tax=Streptomyces sp. 1331.2 TaxID=1938835 RepID=UPI000BD18046|nr:hypothetical protein [Streptomyces sp. 1331.2]SOB79587.1 WD40-like Beta Propeller Repeat [Streptomyces sp. 1331.2]